MKTGGRREEFGAVLSRAEEGAQLAVEPGRGQFWPFLQTILKVALVRVQHRRPFGPVLVKVPDVLGKTLPGKFTINPNGGIKMAGSWCEICHKDLGGFFASAHRCGICGRLVCSHCQMGGI